MNKHGWGLRVELVIILLFLICLVIGTIGLNRLGLLGRNSDPLIDYRDDFSYSALEEKLEEGTKKYVKEFYNNDIEDERVIVRYTTLYNNNYVNKLYDEFDRECSGYTEVVKTSSVLMYYPYIKCTTFTTKGYERRNDW